MNDKHGTCKLLKSKREERHILLGSKELKDKRGWENTQLSEENTVVEGNVT